VALKERSEVARQGDEDHTQRTTKITMMSAGRCYTNAQ
jgi:hypothetical protein